MQFEHQSSEFTKDAVPSAPSTVLADNDDIPTFSYAAPSDPKLKRLLIGAIERMTGQPKLKRMYMENRRSPRGDESFWDAAIRYLQLNLVYNEEALRNIPKDGPLVVVANHPFGVLDGIVISGLIAKVRTDFRVLTNSVLYQAPEIRPFLLPIDFAETREALQTNLRSRAEARDLLKKGGCIVVFPGGAVSTADKKKPFGPAYDPEWKPFTARLIMEARASVVPVYFAGQNSRLFQIASLVSETARLSLLFKEISRRIGTDVHFQIGDTIPFTDLQHIKDRQALATYLRDLTYEIGQQLVVPKSRRLLRRKRTQIAN